ncbi:hypothetical protein MANES_16G020550v8 [Manihot esculenta]|uniref:Uncharacterized protein n=1 Tax=Manihot esculenta TaxID=3983 RepID=A0ACB7G6G1_MANES|nr:hypothetical protein MANES_16G020550v8 [Manihot esculenta]
MFFNKLFSKKKKNHLLIMEKGRFGFHSIVLYRLDKLPHSPIEIRYFWSNQYTNESSLGTGVPKILCSLSSACNSRSLLVVGPSLKVPSYNGRERGLIYSFSH